MIREIREKLGLSQKGCARLCGLSISSYQNIEREPKRLLSMSLGYCLRISKVLKINMYKLIKLAQEE